MFSGKYFVSNTCFYIKQPDFRVYKILALSVVAE